MLGANRAKTFGVRQHRTKYRYIWSKCAITGEWEIYFRRRGGGISCSSQLFPRFVAHQRLYCSVTGVGVFGEGEFWGAFFRSGREGREGEADSVILPYREEQVLGRVSRLRPTDRALPTSHPEEVGPELTPGAPRSRDGRRALQLDEGQTSVSLLVREPDHRPLTETWSASFCHYP